MIVCAPLVEAKQNGPVRVDDLPEVLMSGQGIRLAEQRLVPFEAGRHIADADDCPRALHGLVPAVRPHSGRASFPIARSGGPSVGTGTTNRPSSRLHALFRLRY